MEEELISLVREHKVLFDPQEKRYIDNSHKSAIWRDIASQCGLSSGDCAKDTWKKLRDSYRCSMKRKRSAPSGSAASSSHSWKYETLMSFLQPYMKDRLRTTNEFAGTEVSQATEKEPAIVPDGDGETEEVERLAASPPDRHSSNSKTKANPVLQFLEKESKKKEERATVREELRRKLLQPEDGLKLFFDSMYAVTTKRPIHLQRKIRRWLFNLVSDAEDLAECNRSSSVSIEAPDNAPVCTNLDCSHSYFCIETELDINS